MDLRLVILELNDRPVSPPVWVPEWGLHVHYRTLDLPDEEEAKRGMPKGQAATGLILARGLSHEDGTRIFSDDDAEALLRKHPAVVIRLAEGILKHNQLTPEAVDDFEKKSEAAPRSDSRCAYLDISAAPCAS